MNYILATPNITKIGGAELYALRRIKYLKNNYSNINIILLTNEYNEKDLILKEFKQFEVLEVNRKIQDDLPLKQNIEYLSNLLKTKLNLKTETIIETNCFSMKTLEKVADKLEAKYYIYLTIEIPFFQDKNLKFYIEKMKRGELIGVCKETLRISFGQYYKEEFNRYVNIGFNPEEIKSNLVKTKELNLEKNKKFFRIMIISRLEKKYVEKAIKEVIKVVQKHQELNIELIIIGDSADGRERKRLEKEYISNKNLRIRFLGYVNPIFQELYLNSDLFIGMGTALVNASAFGCISLGIDPRNSKASGFLGIDLFSFAYSSNDRTYDISNKIEEYIFLSDERKNDYKRRTKEFFNKECDFKTVMKKLDSYIFEKKKNKSSIKIKTYKSSILKYYLKIACRKLGIEKYAKEIYKKINTRKKFLEM